MAKLRFGFVGAAGIARKNWKAIRNTGNATVSAVGSRDIARARQFIADCESDAPMDERARAFGSYDELVVSKEIDAVYIPLPTGVRKEWVLKAACAGKHVVCEKPCGVSVGDLEEMIRVCGENKVQFMDGVMFMHSRRLEKLRGALEQDIGPLRRITSAFSFHGDESFFANNIRSNRELEPFGCLGDLGWYDIRLALWTMKEKLPRAVTGRILREASGVPTEFSGELFFEDVSSAFFCSFHAATEQWAVLTGTSGHIMFPDFVLPYYGDESSFEILNTELEVVRCDYNMHPNRRKVAVHELSNSHATAQETNLFRNFAAQVQSGKLNEDWAQIALNTQRVMGACLESARRNSQPVTISA
jgi:predicted dehydrogenase